MKALFVMLSVAGVVGFGPVDPTPTDPCMDPSLEMTVDQVNTAGCTTVAGTLLVSTPGVTPCGTAVSADRVVTVNKDVIVSGCDTLTSISMASLRTVGGTMIVSGRNLASVNFPSLTSAGSAGQRRRKLSAEAPIHLTTKQTTELRKRLTAAGAHGMENMDMGMVVAGEHDLKLKAAARAARRTAGGAAASRARRMQEGDSFWDTLGNAATCAADAIGGITISAAPLLQILDLPKLSDVTNLRVADSGVAKVAAPLLGCAGNIDIFDDDLLTVLELPSLTTVFGELAVDNVGKLVDVVVDMVTDIGSIFLVNTGLVQVAFPVLSNISLGFEVINNSAIVTLDLPFLGTVAGTLNLEGNGMLEGGTGNFWSNLLDSGWELGKNIFGNGWGSLTGVINLVVTTVWNWVTDIIDSITGGGTEEDEPCTGFFGCAIDIIGDLVG